MSWSPETKDRLRKFLGEFWSTQSFSKAEERIWLKSLQHYSPHEVKSAIEEIYAKKDMRRAMPSLKSVLEILRDKHKYTKRKEASSLEKTTGKSFREVYEDALSGKIQVDPKLLEFLQDPKAYRQKKKERLNEQASNQEEEATW